VGRYKVTDPESGKTIVLEGDSAPTEEELVIIFDDIKSSQSNVSRVRGGYLNTDRGNLSRRAEALGMNPQDLFVSPVDDMSGIERYGTALDKGLEDVAYGARQLASHVIPGMDTENIDSIISEREKYYQEGGLADTASGQAGVITGNVLGSMAPGGLGLKIAAKAAPLVPGAVAPFIEGGTAGALEGSVFPVLDDNFWKGKALQTGFGTVVGGTANTGVQALMRGGTGIANAPRRAANAPNDMLETAMRGQAIDAREGVRLAQGSGVQLTPGQASGNKALRFMEQRARESFASAGRVAQGDMTRANQFKQFIRKIAGADQSPEVATELQGRVTNFVRDLAAQRSAFGRKTYGMIDELAKGEKIVQPRHLYDELNSIIQKAGTQEGGDVVKAATQARRMLDTIDKQGGYTAQEALGRLQNYSQFSAGNVFDDVTRKYDMVLKRRIYNALMKDMDEAAVGDTTIAGLVKNANAGWRKFSEQIDSVQQSALGKMVGEEFATDLMNFNKIAPEQVFDKLSRMRPSQARYVVGFLDKNLPDMLPKIRGGMLNDAVDAGLMGAPSGGADFIFNPNQFLSALGLKSGKTGVEGMKRLAELFGGEGSQSWAQMQDIISIARRMGDVYGKNFSGTASANRFYSLLQAFSGSATAFAKRIGSTGMEMAGLRKIADSMEPGNINFGNIRRTELITPPRVTGPLSRAAGVVSAPAVLGTDKF